MSNSFYHKDLTDAQWNKIKFLFPKTNRVGRPALNSRMVLNAVLWILRSGARWRDLPPRYGHWNSIYHKFRLWCHLNIFEKILQIVNQYAEDSALIEIDSTFCKVHQSACSALKNQVVGSSRGWKNTKIHVLVNEKRKMLNVVLTGGQVHDSEKAVELLRMIALKGKTVLADRAFSSKKIRDYIEKECGMYKKGRIVERFFQRIKNFRHISTRYDKLAECFLNFVFLAASVIHF